jgi:hypothetical protein
MADKIAKFKQKLRAKSKAKKCPTAEENLFEKEIQKYRLEKENKEKDENKVESPTMEVPKVKAKYSKAHVKEKAAEKATTTEKSQPKRYYNV